MSSAPQTGAHASQDDQRKRKAIISSIEDLRRRCRFVEFKPEKKIPMLEVLPPELLHAILVETIALSPNHKNRIAELRLVCRPFDRIIREYTLKTLQLEFGSFVKGLDVQDLAALDRAGQICEAISFDMMVVRDDGM
jgi:hypothetical protein